MKFNLSLKFSHLRVIDDLKERNSSFSDEYIVKRYVNAALKLEDNDLIFETLREHCGDGCFASEPQFEINLDEVDFHKLKQICKHNDFMEYGSDEAEVSKIIRCIIKFIEEKPDLISI